MKRIAHLLYLTTAILFLYHAASAQTEQLFLEDFNSGNSTFTLNSGGPAVDTGQNRWVVNSHYKGNGIYPNTADEKNSSGGTIALADSGYLHIYDSSASRDVANCDYNNNFAGDNFAYMSRGFCTLGFTNIHFTFFRLCQGSATDFGSVYYSANGGPWIQCGQAQYNNDTVWTYEDITLPAFDNIQSLQFGFRWQNAGGGGANKMAFGIDEVIAVGTVNTAATISVDSVSPNPDCEGGSVTLWYHLSQPLCDGSYEIYMSNAAGSFSPNTDLGGFTIYAGDTAAAVEVSTPKVTGNCFKFRIDRTDPAPIITGIPYSGCLVVNPCANTIITLQPIVTIGPDTLCDGSAIDVPFTSTGTFNATNTYIAELSDSSGSFANPLTIGSSLDANAYPGFPPGNISGLVPATPAGCNYYIRVISTSPAYSPANYFGPFCIRHCDITTNKGSDISVCVSDSNGADTTISFVINSWNSNTIYNAGNKFLVQLLNYSNTPPWSIVSTGGFGAVTGTTSGTLKLHVPGMDSLALLGIAAGAYYLRVTSTNANPAADSLGTVVRLHIGYSDPKKPVLVSYDGNYFADSVFCAGDLVYIDVLNNNTYTFGSQYLWKSAFNFSAAPQPFVYAPPLGLTLNAGIAPGKYWFMVQEDNNNCLSAWSDTLWITVLDKPAATITSNNSLCAGHTVTFSIPLQPDTYYLWHITGDSTFRIISSTSEEITVLFDSIGSYQVSDTVVNQCGVGTGFKNVNIVHCTTHCDIQSGTSVINATCDLCPDGSIIVQASNGAGPYNFTWSPLVLNTTAGYSDTAISLAPGVYIVCISDLIGCTRCDTIVVGTGGCSALFNLYPDTIPQSYFAQNLAAGVPPLTYLWSWGDGTTSAGAYPSHQYDTAGFYNICLTITDSTGCTNSYCNSFSLARGGKDIIYVQVIPPFPAGIVSPITANSIAVFPNPSGGNVTVSINGDEEMEEVIVTNTLGQLISSVSVSGNKMLNVQLPPASGLYFIHLKTDKGEYVRKVVRE